MWVECGFDVPSMPSADRPIDRVILLTGLLVHPLLQAHALMALILSFRQNLNVLLQI